MTPAGRALEGHAVLVTGAHGGLGSAASLACARAGATVVLLGRKVPRLNRVHDVAEHASIHFAHAATAESRAGRGLRNGWNTDEATGAFRDLVQVGELMGRWFVFTGVGDVLPTAQYDQFAYLDEPLVAPENLPRLRQEWDEFAEATDQWPRLDDAKA